MAFARLFNGIQIGREVTLPIGEGARGFAQHVEARDKALMLRTPHPVACFGNGAAHDEDFAHHPHCGAHGLPDKGLAGTRDQPTQRPALFLLAHQRAADDKAPGCGIDEG